MHLKNGPGATQGGYEDNLVLIAGLLALADGDPKELSLDRALGPFADRIAVGSRRARRGRCGVDGRHRDGPAQQRVAASSPPSADVAGDPGTAAPGP